MSCIEINPYERVPEKVEEWFLPDIPITIDQMGNTFNLATLFKYDNQLAAKGDIESEAVRFCPKLFPIPMDNDTPEAKKAAVKKIHDAIATPCWKLAGIMFNKSRNRKTHDDIVYYLQCSMGVAYRKRKEKRQGNEEDDEVPRTENEEAIHEPMYKENLKETRIVNQNTTSRGPDGKKAPRRTQTVKGTKDSLCKFEIQLRLKVGEFWYLRYHLKAMGKHNHEYIPSNKKHRKLTIVSAEQRQRDALLSQHTHSGSVQAITQAMDGDLPLTRGQLHYNLQTSSGHQTHPNSGAEEKNSETQSIDLEAFR
jgi:hypothetical protein